MTVSSAKTRHRRVLTVDVGGSHVKCLASTAGQSRKFVSGPTLTPDDMVTGVLQLTKDWRFSVVTVGYPGPVVHGMPFHEPANLAAGWVGFDFAAAFGKPVRVINDAAMQALGSYRGGKMLFLGLGTGLGSAMIVDGVVEPMELAHLPYRKGTFEDYVGLRGMQKRGKKRWRKHVARVVEQLCAALEPDEVVLGGGQLKFLERVPAGARLGDNANAFVGGFRVWD
jgi:polyphosphate glucokinase